MLLDPIDRGRDSGAHYEAGATDYHSDVAEIHGAFTSSTPVKRRYLSRLQGELIALPRPVVSN